MFFDIQEKVSSSKVPGPHGEEKVLEDLDPIQDMPGQDGHKAHKAMAASVAMAAKPQLRGKVIQPAAGSLTDLISQVEHCFQGIALPQRLLTCLSFWKQPAPLSAKFNLSRCTTRVGGTPSVVKISKNQIKDQEKLAKEIPEDYQKCVAAYLMDPGGTGQFVPWFVISKKRIQESKTG